MRSLRTPLFAVLLIGLGGCVSLFPKAPPAQLYRFGYEAPAGQPPAAAANPVNVGRMPTDFTQAAEGDRLLTVDGTQTAYIAGARWDFPASTLFDDAEVKAFEVAGGPVRLLQVGDPAPARLELRLEVQTFEARYEAGMKAAPTVIVTVHALLADPVGRKVLSDQIFESRKPASDNRVGAIVQAYNDAATDILNQVVGWTGRQAASGPS